LFEYPAKHSINRPDRGKARLVLVSGKGSLLDFDDLRGSSISKP
jgi:hypothetical protein